MRVSHISESSQRSSDDSELSDVGTFQTQMTMGGLKPAASAFTHGPVHAQPTRVSGERADSVVTVAIIEQTPTGKRRTDYKLALYIGLGIIACVFIALVSSCNGNTESTLIVDNEWACLESHSQSAQKRDHRESSINNSDSDELEIMFKTFDMNKRKSEGERIAELTEEQCREIYDMHVLSSENVGDFKYDLVGKDVDIRLDDQPWVAGMKEKMSNKKGVFGQLYTEFEKLKTIQIAVYLAHLRDYRGWKHKSAQRERAATIFASIAFTQNLFMRLIRDQTMRRYLAYRGLRSQMNNGKWGTILYTFDRAENAPKNRWRWTCDESPNTDTKLGSIYTVTSCGQEGNWFSVYDSPYQTKDTNGTGANSFKSEDKIVEVGPFKRILQAGQH